MAQNQPEATHPSGPCTVLSFFLVVRGRKQRGEWISWPFNTRAVPVLLSPGTSQEKDSSSIWPSLPSSLSFSLCLCLSLVPSLPLLPSVLSPFCPHRRSQASCWGQFHHAGWVCDARGRRARKGKEIAHQLQQGGRSECGDPGGGRQEDVGETRQRQRHHLCPHRHEYGEGGRREGSRKNVM